MTGRVLLLCLALATHTGALRSSRSRPAADGLAPRPWCLADSTERFGMLTIWKAKLFLTDTDSIYRAVRDSAHLDPIPTSSIHFVADEALCERASRAVDSAVFHTAARKYVRVLRAGRYYFVNVPEYHAGEWGLFLLLDERFTFVVKFEG